MFECIFYLKLFTEPIAIHLIRAIIRKLYLSEHLVYKMKSIVIKELFSQTLFWCFMFREADSDTEKLRILICRNKIEIVFSTYTQCVLHIISNPNKGCKNVRN